MNVKVRNSILIVVAGLLVVFGIIFKWHSDTKQAIIKANSADISKIGKTNLNNAYLVGGLGYPAQTTVVSNYLESKNYVGTVLMAKSNTAFLQRGFNFSNLKDKSYTDSDSLYMIGDGQQAVTGLLTGVAVKKNLLKLSSSVNTIISGGTKLNGVTVSDLLEGKAPVSFSAKKISGLHDNKAMLSALGSLQDSDETTTRQIDSNYMILGLILEKVYGSNYQNAFMKNVAQPLQLDNMSFEEKMESQPGATTSYEKHIGSNHVQDYQRKITINKTDYRYDYKNMYSNSSNYFVIQQALIQHKLFDKDLSNKIIHSLPVLSVSAKNGNISSSTYFKGYRVSSVLRKNGADGIVLMSNYERGAKYQNTLLKKIYISLP